MTTTPTPTASEAVRVTIDRAGRLVGVALVSFPDQLRTQAGLDAAVRAAIAAHHASMISSEPVERDARGRLVVHEPVDPPRRPLRELVQEAMDRDRSVPTTLSSAVMGGEQGVSDNDCLTITLDPAGQGGTLSADPGWLRQATATQVGAAVTQAFAAAYARRDAR